jgi:hypothetical protein
LKSIDELANFGKLFMKIVPGAVISLHKWSCDIEPIAILQEPWFKIKGIPIKYENKSTTYYVASMVGKPLILDKNYLRNFSYIRVKIGYQDIELVPNTRIGEIKKEFLNSKLLERYLKLLPIMVTLLVLVPQFKMMENNMTLPRDRGFRTVMLALDVLLPKLTLIISSRGFRERESAPHMHIIRRMDTGKSPMIPEDLSKDIDHASYSKTLVDVNSAPSNVTFVSPNMENPILQQVHREVLDAFAPNTSNIHAVDALDPEYQKFLKTLVDSGSDKAFYIRKKYKHAMYPIAETSTEDMTGSTERVTTRKTLIHGPIICGALRFGAPQISSHGTPK